ncbi:MAG: monovalent cation/H+ antiporter complex subunit F [Hyphomicrobiales bacterium]|nr:monovalent cation/H+ antiporter complex subunit F [Hyphomicrobiales bacterium]MCY4032806.1 monovalent cation/H+ antiporter complex subunit F [Hyphomicrobiales bacterium]MCY4039103.1 monovalent cation/H+ antiporter complex subunit F [Hyphomicrobiales bacterium]
MLTIASLLLLLAAIPTLARLLRGPTLYDRTLAMNVFGTMTTLLIALAAFIVERADLLDIALLYALVNFIGTIAILKFFRYRTLGKIPPSPPKDES